MKQFAIATILALPILPAQADNFTYKCKLDGKSSVVKIDDAKHTLKWRGKTYAIKEGAENDCPRFSWQVDGNGKSFNFCTATQGMADFAIDGKDVQCDQSR